mgnify:CR=1 FL=1
MITVSMNKNPEGTSFTVTGESCREVVGKPSKFDMLIRRTWETRLRKAIKRVIEQDRQVTVAKESAARIVQISE